MTSAPKDAGAAFVTGGSRGIGLAMAKALASKGVKIAIFARDASALDAACTELSALAPGLKVEGFACDVANAKALQAAVDAAAASVGTPTYVIAAAGTAVPGLFSEQDADLQDRHMDVNYRGTRNFIAAALPHMTGGGRIGMISSAAAYLAIYGYSAYTPSKYAVRGLAEVLRLELASKGISVTHVAPPDTDTAQYADEQKTKPAATKEITAAGGLWSPENVAAQALKAMDAGKAEAPIGVQTWALARFAATLLPALRAWQMGIIRRHDRT